eukprot:2043780-Pleurochrysis_carterae.AAC.1
MCVCVREREGEGEREGGEKRKREARQTSKQASGRSTCAFATTMLNRNEETVTEAQTVRPPAMLARSKNESTC